MNQETLKEYKKKLRLYEKLLELFVQIYSTNNKDNDGPGGGTNPPPPPPPNEDE